ncbi:6011_t:CDS:2 [Paraglomus occultum]|uniref:6011_t:CDS:1 n=1 Tax=Paraglomus occultum TaxID=144539 RepID=A0A9N8W3I1_9GLOM|nr:6011_t:CDS:2 [Paraglomus occultum]
MSAAADDIKEQKHPDTKEAAAKFWHSFQQEREAIRQSISDLSTQSRSVVSGLCDKILEQINNLEKKLIEATIYLPTYDQRQLTLQVKSLNEELSKQRSILIPKSKFSFKSRKTAAISTKPTSTTGTVSSQAQLPEKSSVNESTLPAISSNFKIITLHDEQGKYFDIKSLVALDADNKIVDFQLSNLTDCIVNLVSADIIIGAIHIKNLKNTLIMSGPVGSSILSHGCERCVFLVGCHQFRMHDSIKMKIYLHVTSHPIIEDCREIQFAPYTLAVDGLEQMFEKAKLDQSINQYDKVEDFKWLKQQASPNWSLLQEQEWEKDWPLNIKDSSQESIKCILDNIVKLED